VDGNQGGRHAVFLRVDKSNFEEPFYAR
jgi:hypothetical protein